MELLKQMGLQQLCVPGPTGTGATMVSKFHQNPASCTVNQCNMFISEFLPQTDMTKLQQDSGLSVCKGTLREQGSHERLP